ncbi:MAG: regulatory protein RecX [Patulibacter sp.]
MIGATDPGTGPEDDEWGAAPTHSDADEAPRPPGGSAGPAAPADDDWAPAADPLIAETEIRGAAAALGRAVRDDEPAVGDLAPDAGEEWEPAPPLPLGIPKAPKAERRGRATGRRGRRGTRDDNRSSGRRADTDRSSDRVSDDERPPREPKADRPPPTAEERLQLALKHAYRYLAKRDRTVAEVRAHLVKRETDPASLEAAIDELLELQYLDDERYVQRYVEDRRRLDGWGPVRITQGLRKMGIDPPLIEPAIVAVAEESAEDDVDLATDLVQRRFNHRPLDGDKDRQKALRAVVSKGHTLDVAYAAVRAYEERCAEDAAG